MFSPVTYIAAANPLTMKAANITNTDNKQHHISYKYICNGKITHKMTIMFAYSAKDLPYYVETLHIKSCKYK